MSQTNVNALLSQMRTLAAQADNQTLPAAKVARQSDESFKDLMKSAIDKVDGLQANANGMTTAFEKGVPDVNLGDVMVAVQKADLSFRTMSEVRNKLVSAYQEIMNMPV